MAGHSGLRGEDEEGTLSALTAHCDTLIERCIAEHDGGMVRTIGDGLRYAGQMSLPGVHGAAFRRVMAS